MARPVTEGQASAARAAAAARPTSAIAARRDNSRAAAGEFFSASKAYLACVAVQDEARKRLAEATKASNEAHAVMAAAFAVYEGQVLAG